MTGLIDNLYFVALETCLAGVLDRASKKRNRSSTAGLVKQKLWG